MDIVQLNLRNGDKLKSSILIIGFNRPDLLKDLFNLIPDDGRNIYVAIDGPRNEEEAQIVKESITVVQESVNRFTKNSISTKFSECNQGCKYGVFNAINWAFSLEESLIILEDDVRPSNQFFEYCDKGLELFENNEKIWQLNGWTPIEMDELDVNFYQTIHAHIWGWASWKSRWSKFDLEMSSWTGDGISTLDLFRNRKMHKNFDKFWTSNLNSCGRGEIDTWDTQWLYSMWVNSGTALSPTKLLCGNVGFDERATHTATSGGEVFSRLPDNDVIFSLENLIDFDSGYTHDLTHDVICYKLDQLSSEKKFKNIFKRIDNQCHLRKVWRKIKPLNVNRLGRIRRR